MALPVIGVMAMLDIESFLLGIAAGGVGGGGNPNYVETVEGTLANPFGELNIEELFSGLANNGLTLILLALGSSLVGQISGHNNITFGTVIFSDPTDSTPWLGGSVSYYLPDDTVRLGYAKVCQNSVWIDVPATTQSVLTVIHHPLP